jgi:argininosuccinate lyase
MQEDKEPLFDTIDTVKGSLKVFADMVREMRIYDENMRRAAGQGFSTATDVADYLVRKGLPFRDAHEVVGKAVAYCIENGMDITDLSLAEWQLFSTRIDNDIFDAITVEASVNARNVTGGTARERVWGEILRAREGK